MGASGNGRSSASARRPETEGLKVLVTGAAGFIGSHLCERLLESGSSVWGVDNFDPFYDPAIKRRNILQLTKHPNMRLIQGDIRDAVLLDGLFSDVPFDVVVHLAARPGVRPSIEEPGLCFDVNVPGTLVLGLRLQAVVQPSATAVALTTFGGDPATGSERRRHWLLSGRPETARISQLARPPAAMPSPLRI